MSKEDRLRIQASRLKNINSQYKARIAELEHGLAQKDQVIEALKLRIEELERMVFGRKRQKSPDEDEEDFLIDQKKFYNGKAGNSNIIANLHAWP